MQTTLESLRRASTTCRWGSGAGAEVAPLDKAGMGQSGGWVTASWALQSGIAPLACALARAAWGLGM